MTPEAEAQIHRHCLKLFLLKQKDRRQQDFANHDSRKRELCFRSFEHHFIIPITQGREEREGWRADSAGNSANRISMNKEASRGISGVSKNRICLNERKMAE